MSIEEIVNEKELKKVLWACYNYWNNESDPVDKRVICYTWVIKEYKNRFDKEFNESKLTKLADYGILSVVDKPRGGNRVYYKFNNPTEVKEKLLIWGLFD
ncbi:MAG: hypothetical protein ABSC61_02785 [Anaerolineales bacterium]